MKEIVNYEMSDTVLALDGKLTVWLPLAFIWLLVMFAVGYNKYAYSDGYITRRAGYNYNFMTCIFAAGFTVIAGLATWRPMGREVYALLATGRGDATLSVVAAFVAPILWLIWAVIYYNVGRFGSIIKWRQVNRQKRCSEITALLDRVTKNF